MLKTLAGNLDFTLGVIVGNFTPFDVEFPEGFVLMNS